MTRIRISDFVFRICVATFAAMSAALASAQGPARTPTPAPRLSGGFGRPRNTPPPTPAGSDARTPAPSSALVGAARAGATATEKSTLTIDNRSLVKNPSKGRVSTSRAVPAPARPSATAAPAAPTPGAAAASASPSPGTEAEWKEIAARARKRVADDKARVDELSAATKKLENDFYAWDDGQYRDRVIKPAWDRSRTDLETAKQELAEAEKDLADLPEKARRAGALPGWIRE
jgi:hypothetical protein